ncbi:MAG TPA: hypothetical protein VFB27_06070 [Opitutaceae bacterium]|nr:hypothetical protein [Opitutaceae bacterium]
MSSLTLSLRRLVLLALVCFTTALRAETAASVQTAPQTVADAEGHFVAKFPGAVQRGSQPVETSAGQVTMNMIYHDGGASAFMVIYCDYPAGMVQRAGGPDAVCENASKGAVKNVNGTLRASSACQVGKVNGLEIIADVPAQKSVARIRFLIVKDRLYQVMYLGPVGSETSDAAKDFLDSFRLTR